jgi:hypothetical protein
MRPNERIHSDLVDERGHARERDQHHQATGRSGEAPVSKP